MRPVLMAIELPCAGLVTAHLQAKLGGGAASRPTKMIAAKTMIRAIPGDGSAPSSKAPDMIGCADLAVGRPERGATCCGSRLMPQVASSVSAGGRTKRIGARSIAMPTSAATRNASGMAMAAIVERARHAGADHLLHHERV